MGDSSKYSEADKKRDRAIIVFGFIQALYESKKINRPTFEALKKRFGDEVLNGTLSPAYYEEERTRLQVESRSDTAAHDFGRMFIRVENGELVVIEACEQLNISKSSYYRHYRKWKAKQGLEKE